MCSCPAYVGAFEWHRMRYKLPEQKDSPHLVEHDRRRNRLQLLELAHQVVLYYIATMSCTSPDNEHVHVRWGERLVSTSKVLCTAPLLSRPHPPSQQPHHPRQYSTPSPCLCVPTDLREKKNLASRSLLLKKVPSTLVHALMVYMPSSVLKCARCPDHSFCTNPPSWWKTTMFWLSQIV